jgi:hypothetical protein
MSYARNLRFLVVGMASLFVAAATLAAEPSTTNASAKPETVDTSSDGKLTANARNTPSSRSAVAVGKNIKQRPAYCREPQQWYYYDQTPGELADCQK